MRIQLGDRRFDVVEHVVGGAFAFPTQRVDRHERFARQAFAHLDVRQRRAEFFILREEFAGAILRLVAIALGNFVQGREDRVALNPQRLALAGAAAFFRKGRQLGPQPALPVVEPLDHCRAPPRGTNPLAAAFAFGAHLAQQRQD